MIDLVLVNGALGSGKTTWLTSRFKDSREDSDVVVVNEIASHGIDQYSLQASAPQAKVLVIENGCICCDLIDELRAVLRGLVNDHHRGAEYSRIYLETSGKSAPGPIIELITSDRVLQNNIRLREIVVLIDGATGYSSLRHDRVSRDRARVATHIVISRADLIAADVLGQLASCARGLNPDAAITTAELGVEIRRLNPDPVQCTILGDTDTGESQVRAVSAPLSVNTSWAEFAVWLQTLCVLHPHRLFRTKAIVPSDVGPMLIQSVGPNIAIPSPAPTGTGFGVVVIGTDIDYELVAQSLKKWVPSAMME